MRQVSFYSDIDIESCGTTKKKEQVMKERKFCGTCNKSGEYNWCGNKPCKLRETNRLFYCQDYYLNLVKKRPN